MPLLDGVEVPVVELDTQQKMTRANGIITQKVRNIANTLANQYNDLMRFVWEHPGGLTPQEVLDSYGTRSLSLMQLGLEVNELLASVSSEIVVTKATHELAPEVIDKKPTGRIVVGEPLKE